MWIAHYLPVRFQIGPIFIFVFYHIFENTSFGSFVGFLELLKIVIEELFYILLLNTLRVEIQPQFLEEAQEQFNLVGIRYDIG